MNIQKRVEEFVEKSGIKTKPEYRLLDLMSEVGEVAKEILKMTDYGKKKPEYRKEIEGEIGDLMFSLICLANNYNVDVEEALDKVLDKYKKRLEKGSVGSEVE